MDRAEILDGACRRERLREALVGVERVRAECPILFGNHMMDIDPSHRRSCLNRERGSKVKLAIFILASSASPGAAESMSTAASAAIFTWRLVMFQISSRACCRLWREACRPPALRRW